MLSSAHLCFRFFFSSGLRDCWEGQRSLVSFSCRVGGWKSKLRTTRVLFLYWVSFSLGNSN